jgi:hypothetical protein
LIKRLQEQVQIHAVILLLVHPEIQNWRHELLKTQLIISLVIGTSFLHCIATETFGSSNKLRYILNETLDYDYIITIYRMTTWGYTKALPSDYAELERVSKIGANALKAVYVNIYNQL